MENILLILNIILAIILVVLVLFQKSEGGGLGIGQSSAGLGDFLSARGTSNLLTKTTSFLAVCFFLTSLSLVIVANKNFNKESLKTKYVKPTGENKKLIFFKRI